MADSLALAALGPDAASNVVASLASSLSDRPDVRRRVSDLAVLERLAAASYRGYAHVDLDGVSGWLEEQLAAKSESARTLEYLAAHASRRRARSDARQRRGSIRRAPGSSNRQDATL